MARVTRLKKGDTVVVVSGAERTSKKNRGHILKIDLAAGRAIVQGLNFAKKHQRQKKQDVQGGIIQIEAPIRISNLMLVCPKCGEPSRVGVRRVDGKRMRVCKKCDAEFV
ncbi:MAG TPA: 50S ribosomal protein L24 [Candidatus Coatesbacteria bacterium]|nr:50S ribosomal protein L24 [Candidatus Coatesbacteria bacterium]